jgi:hypothetical protein
MRTLCLLLGLSKFLHAAHKNLTEPTGEATAALQ